MSSASTKCVLRRNGLSDIARDMWIKLRIFLMTLLVGAVFAQTATSLVSSAQAAAMELAQVDSASDVEMDDCADTPDCDAPCHLSSQCRGTVGLVGPDWAFVGSFLLAGLACVSPTVTVQTGQRRGDDLQRPPEA
ncbi:MAG: hypothetical protein ACU0CQ_13315 [Sulfitobacter sp.]|uniref:hypothetical protein n=1 Tax=Sulfitobacter sp. TaxID=1903071 RepID=UPI004058FB76